jgi:hypothetical protein
MDEWELMKPVWRQLPRDLQQCARLSIRCDKANGTRVAVITSLDGIWSEQLDVDQDGQIPPLSAEAIAACYCR